MCTAVFYTHCSTIPIAVPRDEVYANSRYRVWKELAESTLETLDRAAEWILRALQYSIPNPGPRDGAVANPRYRV